MIKVNANSLKDFQTCALFYNYKYVEKIPEILDVRKKRAQKFDETIKRVVAFFFYKKQAYAEPSYQALLNRWQKLWFAEGTTATDIAMAKNEVLWGSDTSYTSQAAVALMQFHEEFSNKPEQQVVLVDEKFCVPLDKEIALEGSFDVVLREKHVSGGFSYSVYKWTTSSGRRAAAFWSFDMAFLDYAFRYRNMAKPVSTRYFLWNFSGNTIGSREFHVSKDEHDLIKYWANDIKETKIFAPRRGLTSYCVGCPFDKPCSQWKPPQES